jgi:hypothetical protein
MLSLATRRHRSITNLRITSDADGCRIEDAQANKWRLAGHPLCAIVPDAACATTRGRFSHPLLECAKFAACRHPGRCRQGLCGAQSNVFRVAAQFDPQSTLFITAGRKAAQFIARSGRQLIAEFPYADTPQFAEARAIAAFARDLFLKQEVDQVQIVATHLSTRSPSSPLLSICRWAKSRGST